MEERKINEVESLELITRMIQNTQQNLDRSNGNAFIASGIATLLAAIFVGAMLTLTGNPDYHFGWFLIPILIQIWMRATKKREIVTTHIDKMLSALWGVIGIFCAAVPIITTAILLTPSAIDSLFLQDGRIFLLIPFVEILMVSIGIAVSGVIIDFKALKVAGMLGTVISFFTLIATPMAIVYTFAIWAVACLIIPGIKLNVANKKLAKC